MDQLYNKITIKGDEKNLPKEEGVYFAHIKNDKCESCQWYDNGEKDYWLSNIDWYLQPVFTPEVIVGLTEEQIMTYFNLHCGQMLNSYGIPISVMTRSQAIEMCNWYRSQLKTVNLKDELVKFLEYRETQDPYSSIISLEKYVEGYLSARDSQITDNQSKNK